MAGVTLKLVAQDCGLSTQTVGRILNQNLDRLYRPETVALVRAAAARLGYNPNLLAKSLLTGRSDTVGLVMTEPEGDNPWSPFWAGIVGGVSRRLRRHNKRLLVVGADRESDAVERGVELFRQNCVDGLLVPCFISDMAALERLCGLPAVLLESPVKLPISSVRLDPAPGLEALAEHFAASGRTEALWLRAAPETDNYFCGPRTAAFLRAGERCGLRVSVLDVQETLRGGYVEQLQQLHSAARRAVHDWLDAHPAPQAIAAYREALAAGAMEALKERGIKIPSQTAVAGFDNILAATMYPPLTSVDYCLEEIGGAAVDLLERVIESKRVDSVVIPSGLVVRESSKQ
jgi:LacI family transcriptional regulator